MNPQLSRKEEISKGCGKVYEWKKGFFTTCGIDKCELTFLEKMLCPTCQARLDERIRAEQGFLRLIESLRNSNKGCYGGISSCEYGCIDVIFEELKSTIKQETKE
jgi:hypothetical protein